MFALLKDYMFDLFLGNIYKSINEFNEYSDELIGKKISLTKKLINVHSNREPELVEGILSKIDTKIKYTPLFIISDENGKTLYITTFDSIQHYIDQDNL